MAYLDWNPQLDTGIEEIDGQHKSLVALVNRLNDAIKDGKAEAKLSDILNELREYAKFHFAAEEKLMAAHSFPAASAHKVAHANLAKKVKDYRDLIYRHTPVPPTEIRDFLKDWLIKHIVYMDGEYVKYIRANERAQRT